MSSSYSVGLNCGSKHFRCAVHVGKNSTGDYSISTFNMVDQQSTIAKMDKAELESFRDMINHILEGTVRI